MPPIQRSEDNPFQVLIAETEGNAIQLQSRYANHRANRNELQKAKILDQSFEGWSIDNILRKLDGPEKEDGYTDPRSCLCIWARPSSPIRELIQQIQSELKDIAPSIWLMPPDCLHLTVLELAHSLTEEQIADLVQTFRSSKQITPKEISDYPTQHQTCLLKPSVSFDSSALALSFVPQAGEIPNASGDKNYYSYHHLRRDVFDMVRQTNINVGSRYVVPSAHITIARFINHDGFSKDGGAVDHDRVKSLIDKIEDINQRLETDLWPQKDGTIREGGQFVVGQEQGLVIRQGKLWYGGGKDIPYYPIP